MQNIDSDLSYDATLESDPAAPIRTPTGDKPLHRLALVRRRQGVALRTVARYLDVDIEEAARQEHEFTDLPLSTLRRWQEVLDVPLSELLVESQDELSAHVLERARLIKVMKTAMTILEKSDAPRLRRLSETLIGQLVEIMPELDGVGPWHDQTTPRRRRDDLGRIAERQMPASLGHNIESGEHAA